MGKLEAIAIIGVTGLVGYFVFRREVDAWLAQRKADIESAERMRRARIGIVEAVKSGEKVGWIAPITGKPTPLGEAELVRLLGEKYFPVKVEMARFDF